MALSKKLRFEVFKRDLFTCRYCGQKPPDVMLEVDHVVPVCEGGTDHEANLVTSCFSCNRGKGGTPLTNCVPAIAEDAMRASAQEALERAEVLLAEQRAAEQLRQIKDQIASPLYYRLIPILNATPSEDLNEYERELSKNASRAVDGFVDRMSVAAIHRAIDKTYTKRQVAPHMSDFEALRYFCGVCWGMIRSGEGDE